MVLGFLKSSSAPIAIDFGYAELKILQLAPGDGRPTLISAARLEIPEGDRNDPVARNAILQESLPRMIREGHFRGRTAICSIPGWQTFVQHMQLAKAEGLSAELQIKERLQSVIACDPENLVIRHVEVGDVFRAGESMAEVICFAVNREVVIRQVELLNRCKLEIGGLHAEPIAALRAFEHLYRRAGDENITTLYMDIGANASKVTIAHGKDLKFARSIPIAGRQFDQQVAQTLGCESGKAHGLRLVETERMRSSMKLAAGASSPSEHAMAVGAGAGPSSGGGSRHRAPSAADRRSGSSPREFEAVNAASDLDGSGEDEASAVNDAITSIAPQLADEVRMCLRYHQAMYSNRPVDRMILLGGEARSPLLAKALAERLGVPTFVGDPLKRVERTPDSRLLNLKDVASQPGWGVVTGLCACPTDL